MNLLPRKLATRLTLLNVLVFGLCTIGVIVVVVTLADRFMRANLAENLAAEVDVMRKDYAIDGLSGVRGLIDLREHFDSEHQARTYRLETADGRLLAGHWPAWPAGLETDGGLLRLKNSEREDGSGTTEWLMRATRLPDGNRLLVGFDNYEQLQIRDNLRQAALGGLLVALLLAVTGGVLVNRAALAQIGIITRSAKRIIQGDLSHRIPAENSGDEFDALSRTLNQMLDRINDLIAAIRNATDAIAHDLRSPLTRHRAALEQALRAPPAAEELPAWLHDNLAQLDQVLGSFGALLQLATVESGVLRGQFSTVALSAVLNDAVSLYEAPASERNVRLNLELGADDAKVQGDRNLLFQSAANLLDNALKFSPSGSNIRVLLKRSGAEWMLEVSDEGPGIPQADHERVFDRLFRGDEARNTPGFGLGLSLVRAVARLHGGECRVLPAAQGARLRMTLPQA